jgi:uncharacterized HAD superfamily protein
MPSICIDIDNVIAQTDAVMRRVIQEYTGGRVTLDYEDIKEFNYHECKDAAGQAISYQEWKAVHEEFSSLENLMVIQPYSGVQEVFRKLSQTFTIHLATSRLHKARQATIVWLEQHQFPDPYDLHFLRYGEKHAALSRFFAAVEDDYKQAVAFAHSGTKCYLIRHPWNRAKEALPGVHWVADWAELTPRLLALADVWEKG